MNTEQLIAKGVEKKFDGQQVFFKVESLYEHFDGLQIHNSDIVVVEEGELVFGYVKTTDVNFDNSVPKEVEVKEELLDISETKNDFHIEEIDAQIKSENLKIGIVSGTDENAAELAKVDAELPVWINGTETPTEEVIVNDAETLTVNEPIVTEDTPLTVEELKVAKAPRAKKK